MNWLKISQKFMAHVICHSVRGNYCKNGQSRLFSLVLVFLFFFSIWCIFLTNARSSTTSRKKIIFLEVLQCHSKTIMIIWSAENKIRNFILLLDMNEKLYSTENLKSVNFMFNSNNVGNFIYFLRHFEDVFWYLCFKNWLFMFQSTWFKTCRI